MGSRTDLPILVPYGFAGLEIFLNGVDEFGNAFEAKWCSCIRLILIPFLFGSLAYVG